MIKEVQNYYDENAHQEWERLNTPYSMIEFTTTMHLVDKYFPKTGRILDIGAGPGRYSLALADKGYSMSLLDISQKELELAEKHFEEANLQAEGFHCLCGMELSDFATSSFDGILVLGPLYHLHTKEERDTVINEVHRILKPGGTAIMAYINTLGVLRASAIESPAEFADNHLEKMDQMLSGNVALTHNEGFTAAYFTTAEGALEEVKRSPFEIVSHAGAESFLSGMHLAIRRLKEESEETYSRYLDMAAKTCEHPAYRHATEHLNIVVRKK